jgi:hypothetical protein
MLHRLLLSGLVVIGVAATAIANAAAQPFTGTAAAGAIRDAYALAARIRGYHRWTGLTPPSGSYCATMREGEAVLKELAPAERSSTASPAWHCACKGRAMASAMSSMKRRRSISRPISPTPFTLVRCHRHRIPRVQSCSGASNEGCLSVAGRRMRYGCRSTRADR